MSKLIAKTNSVAKPTTVASAPKIARQERKRFYYIKTKGRFGVLSPKASNLDEAAELAGITKSDITESKELSTNRHDAVVVFCDMVESVPDTTPVPTPVK
jgi:hypothetical protein